MSVDGCLCECVCVCIHSRCTESRGQRSLSVTTLQELLILVLWQCVSLAWHWMDNEPHNPLISARLVLGFQVSAIMLGFLMSFLGIKLRSWWLCHQHCTDRVISVALKLIFSHSYRNTMFHQNIFICILAWKVRSLLCTFNVCTKKICHEEMWSYHQLQDNISSKLNHLQNRGLYFYPHPE